MGCHFGAAVSDHRHDRQPLPRRAVRGRVDETRHILVDDADQLVDEERVAARDRMTRRRARRQPGFHFGPPGLQRLFQRGNDFAARLCPPLAGQRLDPRGKRPPVDDCALVGDPGLAQA